MSDFTVEVTKVLSVEDHPNADRLSIVKVLGFLCISGKLEDGSHRYAEGDFVAYIPEAALLPEWLLKDMEFWNDEKNVGTLSGKLGNRLKAKKIRSIFSQGVLYPVDLGIVEGRGKIVANGKSLSVIEGDNVAEFLEITKWSPPIPTALAGEVCNIFGKTYKYDFESIQKRPQTFNENDQVVATEKLHGTNVQVGYYPNLNHEELFYDGNLFVGSKGLSAQGLVFKNNKKNESNTYVRMLNSLLEKGFGEKIKAVSERFNAPVYVFGEIFGKGIQDLTYGFDKPVLYIFDIRIGNNWIDYDAFVALAAEFDIPVAPLLYRGKYDVKALEALRDGMDTISGTNIREGIVIKLVNEVDDMSHYGRKIAKWVSPDYLLRNNGTEFN